MAVLNVTPDSFSDGQLYYQKPRYHLLKTVEQWVQCGVAIIDIGAESTRPNSIAIDADTQLHRLHTIVADIKANFDVLVSVDTTQLAVMQTVIEQGADIINDVNALMQAGVIEYLYKQPQVGCIIMHRSAPSKYMQQHTDYPDGVVAAVKNFLEERVKQAITSGIASSRICIDPGFGFGKTFEQNLSMLKHLTTFKDINGEKYPILVGISRKSMIQTLCNQPAKQTLYGNLLVGQKALDNGANILRVHDVEQSAMMLTMYRQF